jgi:hypothetical protein
LKATGTFETSGTAYPLTQSNNPENRNSEFVLVMIGKAQWILSVGVAEEGSNETIA